MIKVLTLLIWYIASWDLTKGCLNTNSGLLCHCTSTPTCFPTRDSDSTLGGGHWDLIRHSYLRNRLAQEDLRLKSLCFNKAVGCFYSGSFFLQNNRKVLQIYVCRYFRSLYATVFLGCSQTVSDLSGGLS